MKNSAKIWTLVLLVAFGTTACNTGNKVSDNNTANATIDSLKLTLEILKVQQAMGVVSTSGQPGAYETTTTVRSTPVTASTSTSTPPPLAYRETTTANDGNYTDFDRQPTVPVVNTSQRIEQPKKKMSEVTKGVLIGAGVGAVGGAIVSKKKVKGAVIGGVLGAVGGGVAGKVIKNKREKESTDVAINRLLTSF